MPFDFIIAIDFEATCWDDNVPPELRKCEIIEFPAVLFNLKTGKIEAEFHQYLRPTERPTLSYFCKNLTGISQRTVDQGISLQEALTMFEDWLHKMKILHHLELPQNRNEMFSSANVVFVTWSDFDLGTFLYNECKRKKIKKANIFNIWIDIGDVYSRCYGTRARKFSDALQRAGIPLSGRLHSGIDDARNLAALTYKMVKLGQTLTLN